ncbi:hypothetical protein [Sinorhizobium meliloti]|uniref:hypothetical protein n=2 Tax=Rhizobium meliloti TaxID=382 RepID=UPI000FD6DE10|nr:hypothetical protein [Sinorhizobium meliloti]RVL25261.1 hypothetical protein CN148_34040 [Sinorhizobium meliloti]
MGHDLKVHPPREFDCIFDGINIPAQNADETHVAVSSVSDENDQPPGGLRCALPGCLGIQTAATSANDRDSRTRLQPCFCALDAAVLQNIDDRMMLEIDRDRALPRGMPPAPIINAHNPNIVFLPGLWIPALQLPQDRIAADRHADPMH